MITYWQLALRILTLATLLVAAAFASAYRPVDAGSKGGQAVEPWPRNDWRGVPTNQIIVKYRSSADLNGRNAPASDNRMRTLSATAGTALEYVREMSGEAHVLRLPARLPVGEVAALAGRIAALPDAERDVVETRRSLGRYWPVVACHLEREIVMVAARGEEGDAALLAAAGLAEAERVSVEPHGGVEVADEQGDMSELRDLHGGRSVA